MNRTSSRLMLRPPRRERRGFRPADRGRVKLVWAPDVSIFIVAEDRGRELIGVASVNGGVKPLIADTASAHFAFE